jgi:hypothetical protein
MPFVHLQDMAVIHKNNFVSHCHKTDMLSHDTFLGSEYPRNEGRKVFEYLIEWRIRSNAKTMVTYTDLFLPHLLTMEHNPEI